MNGKASRERSTSVPAAETTSRAPRPVDRDHGPLLGDARAVDAQVGPLGLEPLLEPVEHRRGAAGRGRHEVAVLREAHRDAVVEHHPVEPEHQAVPDRADREVRHPVRVHAVQERRRVGPDDLDLAERRRVHRADGVPNREALAFDRALHRFAVAREEPRALPLPDVLERGPAPDVPRMHRGRPDRVEEVAPGRTRRARGTRHGRRTAAARCDGPCAPAASPSRCVHDLGGEDAARAALIDRRPDVRRPLHVLDGAQPARRRASAMSATVWSRWRSTNLRGVVAVLGRTRAGAPAGTSPAADPTTESHGGPAVRDEASRARRRTGGRRRSRARARGSGSSRPRPRAGRRRRVLAAVGGPRRGSARAARSPCACAITSSAETRVDRPRDVDAGPSQSTSATATAPAVVRGERDRARVRPGGHGRTRIRR